jgi:hypothetical protein
MSVQTPRPVPSTSEVSGIQPHLATVARVRTGIVSPAVRRFTSVLGGFYLTMAGINLGLAIARPGIYAAFANAALFGWVQHAWDRIFMARPGGWAAGLAAGEILVGAALLAGRRWSVAGYGAVIAFHLALLFFGWWSWAWAVPVLTVTIPVALRYLR